MSIRKKYVSNNMLTKYLLLLVLFSSSAVSEIATDGSLGTPATSIKGPDYIITPGLGELHGNNLFHSFSVFNINTGETADFTGPKNIANIFSRVTGAGSSNIDGRLGSSIQGANLYFINPNGIVFGENASLNLSGSFYASTADYITLQDGGRFDIAQSSDVTLSSSPISAFGFLDAKIAPIDVKNSKLQVADGKTLALIGGDININGSGKLDSKEFSDLSNAELIAANGRIDLIAIGSSGEVDIQNPNPVLNNVTDRAIVRLSNAAEITSRGDPGGKVFIRAGQLVIEDSVIDASNTGVTDHQSSAVDIGLSGELMLRSGDLNLPTAIQSSSFSSGASGDIDINSQSLTLMESQQLTKGSAASQISIKSTANAAGNSGDININTNSLSLSSAEISSKNQAEGHSGDINITADTIVLTGGILETTISSKNEGSGSAGNIAITAERYISTADENSSFVGTEALASEGQLPANITLNINEIELLGGAQINVSKIVPVDVGLIKGIAINKSVSSGNIEINSDSILISGESSGINLPQRLRGLGEESITGDVNIKTGQLVVDNLGVISSRVNLESFSNSGNINIDAKSIQLSNAGRISSSAFESGQSGEINIKTETLDISGVMQVPRSTTLIQSGVFSSAGDLSSGADDINITASQSISVKDGGAIAATTHGEGDGGNINLTAPLITVNGIHNKTGQSSEINAGAFAGETSGGNGGDINISGEEIKISDYAKLSSQSIEGASGNAGSVNINAENVSITNGADVSAETSFEGEAGEINIHANNITLSKSVSLTTQTSQKATGTGGDITLSGATISVSEKTEIASSSSSLADAGDITLQASDTLEIKNSRLATEALDSDGGDIILNAKKLMVLEKSDITTSVAGGTGNGGNISIDPELLFINKSNIVANAFKGQGGNINIQADNLIISPDSHINASSTLGVDGELIFNINNDDVGGQIEKISAVPSDESVKFKQNCSAGKGMYSSFVVANIEDSIFEQTGLIFPQLELEEQIVDSSVRECRANSS